MSVFLYPTMNKLDFIGVGEPWYDGIVRIDVILVCHIVFTLMSVSIIVFAEGSEEKNENLKKN